MSPSIRNTAFLLILSLSLATGITLAGGTREIGRTTEKELSVILSSSLGSVHISRGESGKILMATPSDNGDRAPIHIDYSVRNRIGYLEISLGEENEDRPSNRSWAVHGGEWNLQFCDEIPISLEIELGLGEGDFNLSGLMVKDFMLSAGASEVTMRFDEENETLIERMSVESGVSRFSAINLGNANFRTFRFEGGVGSYYLDFGGNLTREVDIDVEVGLGALTMVVPERLGARLSYEKNWISRFECDKEFEPVSDKEFVTRNYNNTDGRLNIRIESGLGSVKIRRK